MIIDLVLRTGVVVAVVIATNRLGIWDSTEDSIQLYNESKDKAAPHAQYMCQYLNIHVPDLPPTREKTYLGIYYYNQAVMTIFNFLATCPTYVCMVLEKVPAVVSEYGKRAKEAYDEYQKQRAIKKEKEARKIMIDDKTLVMPLEPRAIDPNSDCKCQDKAERNKQGLMPKNAPKSPYSDPYCDPKKPLQDPQCKCPKCDRRQAEGWLDNKTRCPKRDPCANQFQETPPKCEQHNKQLNETPRRCEHQRTRIIYAKGAQE